MQCRAGAGYTDNNSGNGQAHTCAVGTFAGTLLTCTAVDCSSTVPNGAGFFANYDGLVTDAAQCMQTCSAGYTDNNSGNGQAHTSAAGTIAGTLLTCTAADCSSTVSNGAGFFANCDGLVTDAPFFEAPRKEPNGESPGTGEEVALWL